ncbi:MAG: hypothetical protein M0002_11380 [Rhodospirillales bacterium]|nr:hypothetical protein [Rhodospirillales bacterium]
MGLLTYSVKGSLGRDNADISALASQIVQLDRALRNYGPAAADALQDLRRYTETVIASTWPNEPKPLVEMHPVSISPITPGGIESRGLGALLNSIGLAIRRLAPASPLRRGIAASCLADFHNLEAARWTSSKTPAPPSPWPSAPCSSSGWP